LTLLADAVLIDIVTIYRLQTDDVAIEAIRWFGEISLTDVALVGGKGANLGELTTAGLPVPPSFVVTATAYLDAVSESGAGVARPAAGRA
jgi:Pyruvate phosphate dikinase, AMP/ATP-binding domain